MQTCYIQLAKRTLYPYHCDFCSREKSRADAKEDLSMSKASAQTRETVQPEGTCQIQCTKKQIVKIVLGLMAAGALLTLIVAFVAPIGSQQDDSQLKENSSVEEKLYELQTMLAKPIETEMPQQPPIGAKPSKSHARPKTTTTTSTSPDTSLRSCAAILSSNPSAPSGVYTIYTGGWVPGRKAWCDMVTDGGGWTRFQRRKDGSVTFNKTWHEYRRGFGSADADGWLGNDDLHRLTAAQLSELRVDLMDWNGTHGYGKFFTFSVGNASTNFKLHVAGYSGTIGDSLLYHRSQQFTTLDRDNDKAGRTYSSNCATISGGGGGWWYNKCHHANLNGRYYSGGVDNWNGVNWWNWKRHKVPYSYKETAMSTRPLQ